MGVAKPLEVRATEEGASIEDLFAYIDTLEKTVYDQSMQLYHTKTGK